MKLAFGMVGGGGDAFIGNVHRRGATADCLASLQAGCFSRDSEKNRATARAWDVADESRVYQDYREMAEAESGRADGIDFVSIVTPTDTHYDIAKCFLEHGIHVVCDKPICMTLAQGLALQGLARARGLSFGVTYTYASYAVIRQAREMIEHGEIGRILNIVAEYPQDWLIAATVAKKSAQSTWRTDPARAGSTACCSDIGTHLEALISRMTGLRLEAVLARFTHFRGSPLEHDIQVLLRYEQDIPGMLWASQIATGNDCGVRIRVFGDKGALEWSHTAPMQLLFSPLGQPTRILSANKEYCYDACTEQCRLPAGHPEGFYEAFANIYRSYCLHLLAEKGQGTHGSFSHPTVDDGVAGLRFAEACLRSAQAGNVWTPLYGEAHV